MPKTISNGNPWNLSETDHRTSGHAWPPKTLTQSSGSGHSEQSHYAANHSDNTWSGKNTLDHGGIPPIDASHSNHDLRGLVESYSGGHHLDGSHKSTTFKKDHVQNGNSNSNGSDSSGSTGGTGGTGSAGSSSNGSTGSTGGNGSGMGVQLNFAGGDTISSYEQRTGVKPASVGGYISANNGTLDMSSAENYIQQAGQNGVPTVQLSISSGEKGAMSPQELSQFTQLAQQAKSQGVNLQVRFGYEMNLNSVSGYSDPNTFKQQWDQVAGAVHSGGGQMVWSPANSTQSDYQKWMPDPSTIDVVGLDVYHMGSGPIQPNEVKNAISGIESVPGLSGKPLTLPETGVQLTGDGSDSSKVSQWLSQLSDPSLKAQYPNYQGFMWFDYNKPGDGNYALSQNSQYEQALTQWYKS